jgi:hypothetical protein
LPRKGVNGDIRSTGRHVKIHSLTITASRATKSLLFLPPAPEQIRISGWRPGSFKLENLILNHERKPKPTLIQIQFQNLV